MYTALPTSGEAWCSRQIETGFPSGGQKQHKKRVLVREHGECAEAGRRVHAGKHLGRFSESIEKKGGAETPFGICRGKLSGLNALANVRRMGEKLGTEQGTKANARCTKGRNQIVQSGEGNGRIGEITVIPIERPSLELREDDTLNNSTVVTEIQSVLEALSGASG